MGSASDGLASTGTEARSRVPLISVNSRSVDRGGSQASAWDCHGAASSLQAWGAHGDP